MPPPSKTGRSLTKQPVRPARYFPGKQIGEDPVSDEESDEDEEQEEEQEAAPKASAPKFSSFPKKDTLAARPSIAAPKAPESKAPDLEGFETASESSEGEEDGSGSEEEDDSSDEDESSSDDEPKRPMLAPKFISKAKRAQQTTPVVSEDQKAEEEERKRKEKADELLQAQIERERAARAAGKKFWDDDDAVDEVDDRDGIDPEAERAAWKLRELKRVKRDRQALIAKEQEREEVERRRNMTAEEREKEDREYIEKQQEEQEGKGKMNYLQKYFHKGAFFGADDETQDEEVKAALNRDVAGRKFVDEAGDKSVLPEYMKIRDSTRLGKKGRTRYKDLKSEDTGSWGRFEGKKREFDGVDERFRPDEKGGGAGEQRTGANSAPVGERRRRDDDAGREEKRPRYD